MNKSLTVDDYIATFPTSTQKLLQEVRRTIHQTIPKGEEVISYSIPCVKLQGKYLVYFAGWAKHISLYPVPAGDAAFQEKIAPYQTGKGTLQFKLDKPVPHAVIKQVVIELAKRVQA